MGLDINGRYGFDFMHKGHEIAEINSEACIGCGKCVDICQFQGIRIDNGKAKVTPDCHGCGNCVHVCGNEALALAERG